MKQYLAIIIGLLKIVNRLLSLSSVTDIVGVELGEEF